MPSDLFERFIDLQKYVGWTEEDAARVAGIAARVEPGLQGLIDDFYSEIQRHPDAARVITGGQGQIDRLKGTLRRWLREMMQCRFDAEYVERRWKIGLQHVLVGLDCDYTSAAMSRLRTGILQILAKNDGQSKHDFWAIAESLGKLLDLELTIIQNAYQAESLKREKSAEHERGEARFRMLVEAAACMVVILRRDGSIAYFSPFSEELTGYHVSEAVGASFSELLVPEMARADVSQTIAATFAGRPAIAHEIPILRRDGSRRWLVWNARRLDDFEGSPAMLAVGQDVTERREAQERLLRSERLAGIGQMMTGIAHESRNALQRIQSCTEMLELEVENNEQGQRLVRRLQGAQDNLLRLFDEVRGYAAPIQLELENIRIDSTWREAWDSLETVRRGRDAALTENTRGADLNVSVDRFRIVQLFRNLLENSLAACSDPVRIHIECRDAHLEGRSAVELRVRDNGPGLSESARHSIFEPFFTTKTKGTGLGMAIARRIIEAHGGQICIGSNSSAGAEFIITFLRTRP